MNKSIYLYLLLSLGSIRLCMAQAEQEWTLEKCIQYAQDHNLQVKQLELTSQSLQASYEQARANRWPSLNASGQQLYTRGNSIDPVTSVFQTQNISATNLSLNANVSLFNGFQTVNNIQQQKLALNAGQLDVAEAENEITIAVTQAYLQLLYDRESIINAEQAVEASEAQLKRAKVLLESGSSTQKDYAQVQAQYASDQYTLITAQSQFAQQKLALQQLLEIPLADDFELYFPVADAIPTDFALTDPSEIYNTALTVRPEVQSSELSVNMAGLGIKMAKANQLPQLSLSGSLSTGYTSTQPYEFPQQLDNNFYQRVALNLSIPIFNNKEVSTAITQSKLDLQSAQLNLVDTKKTLQENIETAYLNAGTAQSRLDAAEDQLEAMQRSYELADQQYNLGMLNAVDLLLEKNNFLEAQQEYLQAKYATILNFKLLDFYQGTPISLE